jgi:phage-related minor tail protein
LSGSWGDTSIGAGFEGFAKGGLFHNNKVIPFASGGVIPSKVISNTYNKVVPFASGGIITQPTTFPISGGRGLAGEKGYEAIMPITRTPGGDLGVNAQMAAPKIKVVVNNNTGQKAQVSQEGPSWNGQEWVVGVWLDAYHRNKGGLRTALGV